MKRTLISDHEQEHVSVSSKPKDFQTVYEGEIWCLLLWTKRVQNWIVLAQSTACELTVTYYKPFLTCYWSSVFIADWNPTTGFSLLPRHSFYGPNPLFNTFRRDLLHPLKYCWNILQDFVYSAPKTISVILLKSMLILYSSFRLFN